MAGIVDPGLIVTDSDFAQALVVLRARSGCSIRGLARITGIPSATLGGYFAGRHLPPATQPQVLAELLAGLGVTDPVEVAGWRDALHRVRRGLTRWTDRGNQPCPYRGLEPFTDADQELFFGREQVVAELVNDVLGLAEQRQTTRMLVLVGASGSGKSSTLRAGLVPEMRNRESWSVAVIVPGTDPLASLRQARETLTGAQHALLIVDQAEEIFSSLLTTAVRRGFLSGLLELADPTTNSGSVVVVTALRADFYGQAAAVPELLPVLRDHQVLLGAMDLDDLRRAVIQPAAQVGVQVETDLVELLVRDLHPRGNTETGPGYNPGALPLVSHAMLATWTRHRGTHLNVTDYLGAGGIAGAVQQSAETAVSNLDQQGRIAAQWLFTQLVIVDEDTAMTRRRINHEDLRHPDPDTDLALDDVIEAFVSARLLTADDQTLEISHEALLTEWPRLREWVLTDLDSARLQQRIADSAAAWRERDHDPGALLRGAILTDAQALAARPLTSTRILTSAQMQYVAASSAQATDEATAAHRRTRRLQTLLAVMTALALVAATLTVVTQRALTAANTARDEALSRQLAITADELRERDPSLAAQLSLAAYRTSPTLQARSSLLSSTAVATPTRFVGPSGDMHAVASPDGQILAISGADGKTRLWQMSQPPTRAGELPQYQAAGELDSGSGPIYASAFSPNGRWLAISGGRGSVTLWDFTNTHRPSKVADLDTSGSTVYSLTFNHDSNQLAAGTSQPSVHRWAVSNQPQPLPTIAAGFTGPVNTVAYHPANDVLAAGGQDGYISTWQTPLTDQPQQLGTAKNTSAAKPVRAVTYSPDGKHLATGDEQGRVSVFKVTNPRAPKRTATEFPEIGTWLNSLTYSPDGQQLFAASSDSVIRSYRTDTGALTTRMPGPSAFTAVQYVTTATGTKQIRRTSNKQMGTAPVHQSHMLLTAELSGTARLWPLPGPTLTGYKDAVWVVAAADPPMLAVSTGRGDPHIHLYDNTNPEYPLARQDLTIPPKAGETSSAMATSSDGRWIAAGSITGNIVVWERNPKTGKTRLAGIEKLSKQRVHDVTISSNGSALVAMDNSKVGIWSLKTGKTPTLRKRTAVIGMPQTLAFNPDASLLAVGTTGSLIHLWRLPAEQTRMEDLPPLDGFNGYIASVSFDPTGRYMAASDNDQSLRIFDAKDPNHLAEVSAFPGPQQAAHFLSWNLQGSLLAAADMDSGTVWLWEVSSPASPRHVATLQSVDIGRINTITFSPDGNSVYAGGSGRTIKKWKVHTQTILNATCQRTGTPMTQTEWERFAADVDFTPPCTT